jgi:hypothetical protein
MFAETIEKTGFWLEDLAQELGNIPPFGAVTPTFGCASEQHLLLLQ